MLEQTFLHLPGVGRRREANLWQDGCRHWDDLIASWGQFRSTRGLSRTRITDEVAASRRALVEGDHQFFRRGLPLVEAWRAWPHFPEATAYLDIETNGTHQGLSTLTVIGIFDGKAYHSFVQGENLGNFRDAISRYSVIVTFFGTGFDLPVIQRELGVRFDQIHVDLHPMLKRLGYRGGLKKLEGLVDYRRDPRTVGMVGYDAVKLWQRYQRRYDAEALDLLLAYNEDDVRSLLPLAEFAYRRMTEATWAQYPVRQAQLLND